MSWTPFGPRDVDRWGKKCGYPTEPGIYDMLDPTYYDWFRKGEIDADELEDYADYRIEVRHIPKHGLMWTPLHDGEGVWEPVENLNEGYWRRSAENRCV